MADSKISEELAEVKTSKIPVAQTRSDNQLLLGGGTDSNATASQRNGSQITNVATSISSPSNVQQTSSSPRRLAPSIDGVLEGTQDKLTRTGSRAPSWPTSPRLKSPPPSASRISAARKEGSEQQSNTAKRLATVSAPELAAAMLLPESARDQLQGQSSSHLRVPGRGPNAQAGGLETVVEGSAPTTPSASFKPNPMDGAHLEIPSSDAKPNYMPHATAEFKDNERNDQIPPPKVSTSRNDIETKARASSTSRASHANLSKKSYTSLTGNKKTSVEPLRTMTVETEEVNTTTPLLIDRNRDGSSVRTKTSTETIRPKKEKKKTSRKPASIHAGVGTSKADIFEAKVASAVDEVDTDDSDETFVYESNPPEPRSQHHHSRSPSATSLTSANDHNRSNKYNMGSGSGAMLGKRSMKFSNSLHRGDYDDDQNRNPSRYVSATPRHHHIGRHGRSHDHPSLFDNGSPFNQSQKPQSPRIPAVNNKALQTSRPNSPRIGNARLTSPRKYGANAYDNNEDAADDERAPLMGSVRVARNRHSRRPHSRDFRSLELGEDVDHGLWSRCSGCLMLLLLLILVSIGLAAFVVIVNRPLYEVEIRRIVNVLASEQELMLDLDVKAVNPNLFGITVSELDVNLFAESPYVGTTPNWHKTYPSERRLTFSERRKRSWFWPTPRPTDGVDEGTDPEDPDPGIQKMLLGQITEFDSPLTFDPAPLRRIAVSSVGEIRLAKPGNKTEVDGSERWEKVLHHDFDLIVRGVIKYQLPLSSKIRSAKISGSKTVHPAGEDEKKHQ